MQINTILNRYMLKEMTSPFFINLAFFMFIFLMSRILDVMHLVVNYNAGLLAVVLMMLYNIPYFMIFIIPLSAMMSVLLTLLRMSSDNEVIALKSGGVSIYQLTVPVILFCSVAALLTATMTIFGLPWGKKSFNTMLADVATSSIDIGLKERTFNDSFENVMLYVSKIDIKSKTLMNIFIEDQRDADILSTVISPRGKLFIDPDKKIFQLRLFDGVINQISIRSRMANTLKFDTYDINLDMKQSVAGLTTRENDEKAMWLNELKNYIDSSPENSEHYYQGLLEFHRKFSMPVACLVLGLLAFPLGLQAGRTRQSMGLGLGLLFFLSFYLLFSAGKVYGETGTVPPWVGMWTPNVIMAGLAGYLFRSAGQDNLFRFSILPRQIRKLLIHW